MMLTLPFSQKDFQEPRLFIWKDEFLTLGYPEKKKKLSWLVWQQTALAGSGTFIGRRGRGRPVKKADCSAWVPTALPQPCPRCFSCQLSLWACPGPRAVCCFLQQAADPPYVCISKHRAKKQNAAWLPSDLVLRRPLLLLSELGKCAIFLPWKDVERKSTWGWNAGNTST